MFGFVSAIGKSAKDRMIILSIISEQKETLF